MKINVLGTKYKIETHKVSEDETLRNNRWTKKNRRHIEGRL